PPGDRPSSRTAAHRSMDAPGGSEGMGEPTNRSTVFECDGLIARIGPCSRGTPENLGASCGVSTRNGEFPGEGRSTGISPDGRARAHHFPFRMFGAFPCMVRTVPVGASRAWESRFSYSPAFPSPSRSLPEWLEPETGAR